MINRSPAYKDKYVHHRVSVGVDLSEQQIDQLAKMGLLKHDSFEHSIYKRSNTTESVVSTIDEGDEKDEK